MSIIKQNYIVIEPNGDSDSDACTVPSGQVTLHAAYGVRYIELTRPIAGAFFWCIHQEVVLHTGLTGSSLLLVGSSIANFIAWLIGEQIIHRLCNLN